MASATDYEQLYGEAKKAYLQGNFEAAADQIERMAQEFPDDPTVLLLRGHIYGYGLHQYTLAKQQYSAVLELTDNPELAGFATKGLEEINQWDAQPETTDSIAITKPTEIESPQQPLSASGQDDFANPFVGEKAMAAGESDAEPMASPFDRNQEQDYRWQDADTQEQSDDDPDLENEEPTFVVSSAPRQFDDDSDNSSALFERVSNSERQSLEANQADNSWNDENSPEDFQVFQDDLEDISSSFSMVDVSQELPDSSIFSSQASQGNNSEGLRLGEPTNVSTQESDSASEAAQTTDAIAADYAPSAHLFKPTVEVKQGPLAILDNAAFAKKQWLVAAVTGVVSAIAVAVAGSTAAVVTEEQDFPWEQIGIMSLVSGAASFGTVGGLGQLVAHQMKRSTKNLQKQFEAVYQGDFDAKATVYSEDELGQLAAGFNQMSRVMLTTTKEAQRRAEETEQAREDLQRQVIRLLDDVEGSARGDLTVQAQVTADVLGAVADAFNLTIQNLREIVQQVKQASLQVNKGSTDSELFARNQSSDALRMAEELAVTLNSVQMMTDSIQRVAENAREAEEVARSSSATALKGGESVESTVAGILQIRETVSETARKVKRLAEASQEISKIVALISQIASRTNLLALNASIQAARAGDAGKGFAVVADEVRQLADRSAKALKEIEQIVLQIQTETGSVMTAMEEGIQQVLDVTNRAEQAKTSLEDIIQVSNRIDSLVRSITADTVEQRENSRAVAQVMQSVELTAQETSQESQRVAGSLQNLVGISQELLASVERFRIAKET